MNHDRWQREHRKEMRRDVESRLDVFLPAQKAQIAIWLSWREMMRATHTSAQERTRARMRISFFLSSRIELDSSEIMALSDVSKVSRSDWRRG